MDERGPRRAKSSARLRAAGLRGSRLRGLRVLARNESERVARIRVDGFTPSEISGHEFRMAVGRVAGWQSIKSTAFDVDRTGTGYRFRGRGFGHGVGLVRDRRRQARQPRRHRGRNSQVLFSGPGNWWGVRRRNH